MKKNRYLIAYIIHKPKVFNELSADLTSSTVINLSKNEVKDITNLVKIIKKERNCYINYNNGVSVEILSITNLDKL